MQDAPISRIDLLVCRNTLMYFNAETQARILTRFHFALAEAGVLFLGKAEMLLSHGSAVHADRPEAPGLPQGCRGPPRRTGRCSTTRRRRPYRRELAGLDLLRNEALLAARSRRSSSPRTGSSRWPTGRPSSCSGCPPRDVGRPFRDLELSYRPLELRRHIEQAQVERRTVRVTDVTLTAAAAT